MEGRRSRSHVLYIVTLLVFAIDQGIKWWVRTHLILNQPVTVIPYVVEFLYTRNSGGAFSIFPHDRWLFVTVAVLVIAGGIYVHRRFRLGRWSTVALGLVLGGALGNMADRVVTGYVTDYVYLLFVYFPAVFNFADVCLDAGIIMWILKSIQSDMRRRKEVSEASEESRG